MSKLQIDLFDFSHVYQYNSWLSAKPFGLPIMSALGVLSETYTRKSGWNCRLVHSHIFII